MMFLTCLLVFIKSIPESIYGVEKVYLLENKLWGPDNEQVGTDQGFLNRVEIGVTGKSKHRYLCSRHYPDTNYHLTYTEQYYLILEKDLADDFDHFFYEPAECKGLLEVKYLFTDKLIGNAYRKNLSMYDQKLDYMTYLIKEKSSERNNKISMISDGIDVRNTHIKYLLFNLCSLQLQKFDQYVTKIEGNRPGDGLTWFKMDAKYTIYYFKDYYSCFENIKKFIGDLRYLNFVGGSYLESVAKNLPGTSDSTKVIKIANFIRTFREEIEQKKNWCEDSKADSECEYSIKKILDKCFDILVKNFETNNLFFPVGGKYNLQFYYGKLQEIVCKRIINLVDDYFNEDFVGKENALRNLEDKLRRQIHHLSLTAFYDLFKTDYIFKHFANVYGQNFKTQEDYVCLDKILCDYFSTFLFIFHSVYPDHPVCYIPPVFVNDFDYNLVSCIEIDEECLHRNKHIMALDDNGYEVKLYEDVHYFVKGLKRYYSYDVIKRMNIYEFDLASYDINSSKRLKVYDFLNN
jgi:hypothetical protein